MAMGVVDGAQVVGMAAAGEAEVLARGLAGDPWCQITLKLQGRPKSPNLNVYGIVWGYGVLGT
jgi:hypothetical protein